MTKTSTLALLVAVGSAVGLAAGDPTVAVLVRVAARDGPVLGLARHGAGQPHGTRLKWMALGWEGSQPSSLLALQS
jgi:hypothetical protein